MFLELPDYDARLRVPVVKRLPMGTFDQRKLPYMGVMLIDPFYATRFSWNFSLMDDLHAFFRMIIDISNCPLSSSREGDISSHSRYIGIYSISINQCSLILLKFSLFVGVFNLSQGDHTTADWITIALSIAFLSVQVP